MQCFDFTVINEGTIRGWRENRQRYPSYGAKLPHMTDLVATLFAARNPNRKVNPEIDTARREMPPFRTETNYEAN